MENKNEIKLSNNESKLIKASKIWLKSCGWSPDDIQAHKFISQCIANNLNPARGEIYAVINQNRDGTQQLSVRTSYEVYIKRALIGGRYWRHDAVFNTEKVFLDKKEDIESLTCQVTFYDKNNNVIRKAKPISIKQFLPDFWDKCWELSDKDKSMYKTPYEKAVKKCPFYTKHCFTMLEKDAVVNGLRFIGGEGLSNLPYIKEEMGEINEAVVLEPLKKEEKPLLEKELKNIKVEVK